MANFSVPMANVDDVTCVPTRKLERLKPLYIYTIVAFRECVSD